MIVTHAPDVAPRGDRTVHLRHGKVVHESAFPVLERVR
mgnify:FL=1